MRNSSRRVVREADAIAYFFKAANVEERMFLDVLLHDL